MPGCLGRNTLHRWSDWLPRPDKTDHVRLRELLDLERFQYINGQDTLGRSPLHIVCRSGWLAGVDLLLSRGANIKAETVYRSLPLHYAAVEGHLDICRLLIENCFANSYLRCRDWLGKIAVDHTRLRGHTVVTSLLTLSSFRPCKISSVLHDLRALVEILATSQELWRLQIAHVFWSTRSSALKSIQLNDRQWEVRQRLESATRCTRATDRSGVAV